MMRPSTDNVYSALAVKFQAVDGAPDQIRLTHLIQDLLGSLELDSQLSKPHCHYLATFLSYEASKAELIWPDPEHLKIVR